MTPSESKVAETARKIDRLAGADGDAAASTAAHGPDPGSSAIENAGRPAEISRVVSAGVEESLERFSDPALLAQGKVNLISLEAVQARLSARWNMRKDQVYSFAERVIDRGLGAAGLALRISDTDYFIIHTELGRLAGQAACVRYLREILNHFLGDGAGAAAGVLQVTKFVDGRLEAQQCDVSVSQGEDPKPGADPPHEAPDEIDGPKHSDLKAVAKKPEAGIKGTVNAWTPFVSNDGRQLRVSAVLEPVYELKGFTRIGFRMIRRVIEIQTGEELTARQVSLLSAADQLKVDMATITRGIDRLKGETGDAQQLSLIVPISFSSLSTQRGRTELIGPLREASSLVKLGVICEICDVEGVPQGALLSATSLVKPFSLLVVARLNTPTPNVVNRLKETGLQAVSFECPPGLPDGEFIGWASAAIRASKAITRSVLVYRAEGPARAGTLASLGASHVSLTGG